MIYLYDTSNGQLVQALDDRHSERVDAYVINYNAQHKTHAPIAYVQATSFPPVGQKFDARLKEFRAKTFSEKVASGEAKLPPGTKLSGDDVVPLTSQERVDAKLITLEELKSDAIVRVKSDVLGYLESAVTSPNGYHVDSLCKDKMVYSLLQKPILSPEEYAAGVTSGLYYATERLTEMQALFTLVNTSALQAISAIQSATAASVVESVRLSNYLPKGA